MFKKLAGLTAIAGLLFAGTALAQGNMAGSAHDFSDELAGDDSWNTSGEMCVVCHTPHMTLAAVADAPLWNHTLTAAAGFTLYSGAQPLDGTITQPAGISRLCLSCHDGTIALDSYGATPTSTTFVQDINANFNVTQDLSNDHPISITYTDPDLAATTALSNVPGSTGTIADDMLFGGSDTVECASCHDVHRQTVLPSLLIKSNVGSALCQTCHQK